MPSRLITLNLNPNIGGKPDEAARASMVSPQERLDIGSLMRYLDWQAGMMARDLLPQGVGPVTVNVEGGHVKEKLELDKQYLINMVVTRSGGSSLEIQTDILASPLTDSPYYVTSFYFSFVAIDKTGKPVKEAPDFKPGSAIEETLLEESLSRKKGSIDRRDRYRDLRSDPIADYAKGPNILASDYTTIHIPSYASHTDDNLHGIIFGGQIMKTMFDHAWSGARATLEKMVGENMPMPLVAAINGVTFDTPVRSGYNTDYDITSIFSSAHSLVQRVVLSTYNSIHGVSAQSNTATFTFAPAKEDGTIITLDKKIVPSRVYDNVAYNEALLNREHHKKMENMQPMLHDTTLRLLEYR